MPALGMGLVAASAAAAIVAAPVAVVGVALVATGGGVTGGTAGTIAAACIGAGGPGGGAQTLGNRTWNAEQMNNAQTIIGVVMGRGLPQRAAVIAVATVIVESVLTNDPHGDRDSLGLFQQRPSQGWGTPEQVLNPVYATNTFLDHLVALPNWWLMPPGQAEQAVQRSAFPGRYGPQEPAAQVLVGKFWSGPDNLPPVSGSPAGGSTTFGSPGSTAGGCPDQGGSGLAFVPQQLPPDFRPPSDQIEATVVSYALAQLGKPYVWAGKGPNGFDCSGLVEVAWASAGVAIPAGTSSQVHAGTPVASVANVQPGDLLFIPGSLGTPRNPRHVGMYVGDGLVEDAYDEQRGVILESLSTWAPEIVAIRHIAGGTAPAGSLP